MKSRAKAKGASVDNNHQKSVSGKNQRGPDDKVGKNAGGNQGSRGQNTRSAGNAAGRGGHSVGSHKPGGDGPGTKTFKHEHDREKRRPRR